MLCRKNKGLGLSVSDGHDPNDFLLDLFQFLVFDLAKTDDEF